MTLADFIFIFCAFITLAGAFLAVSLKNVFYNALALILCLFGVACLFVYLGSDFLAVIEVIVYIGAIAVAILFAIMLSQPMFQKSEPRSRPKLIRAFLLAGALGFGIVKTLKATVWPTTGTEGDYSIGGIGKTLLTSAVLPFETVSLVLLVAIIGALVISSKVKENKI